MKHLKSFTIIFVFFVVAAMFLVPFKSSSSPNPPDMAPVVSYKDYKDQWQADMLPIQKKVDDTYDLIGDLVSAYQSAHKDHRDVVFSAVSNSVQTNWVSMTMGVYNTSKDLATKIAKTQTLQSAVEEAASLHSSYLGLCLFSFLSTFSIFS